MYRYTAIDEWDESKSFTLLVKPLFNLFFVNSLCQYLYEVQFKI